MSIDDFVAGFGEEPGYLDFARVGPLGRAVLEEQRGLGEQLGRARFGSLDTLERQDARVRDAVAGLLRFRPDQVVFQPNTSSGLMHAMFGITGGVAMSPAEYPSLTFAAARAAESLGVLKPTWLETEYGKVTPGMIRGQLPPACTAVAVSLVDYRTGYLADLDGIRQVIGDRLLIVDAVQAFGVVDAPWNVADVIVSGGQKWARAGWGTGFLALSDRAAEALTPVFSGVSGAIASGGELPLDEILPPAAGAAAFSVSNPSPVAQAMFATALEGIAGVGVAAIHERVAEKVSTIIELADEFAIPIASSRAPHERAGIVVLDPPADRLTNLTASLYNHGVTSTTRQGRVRLSAHATTGEETFAMLRAAFAGYGATAA